MFQVHLILAQPTLFLQLNIIDPDRVSLITDWALAVYPWCMDKEEKTQLEAPKESEITEITEENKTLKTKDQEEEDNKITVETGTVKNIDVAVEEISGAEAAEESMKEEIKEAVIAVNNATEQTAETTELVKEEAKDQSDGVAPISVALVSETSETETTELVKEEAKDQSDDVTPISAALVSETGEIETTELVKEEAKDQSDDVAPVSVTLVSETGETVAVETTELVKEEAEDQSDVTPVSATLVSETGVASVTPNPEEQKQTEDLATPVAETHEEDKQGVEELVKEEIKETDLPNHVTPVAVTETIGETKDAEPNHEEQNKVVEIVNESANLQQEAKLPEVESEDLKLQDTSVAATVGEEEEAENKETDELVKQVIKESELPDSSVAVTPVVDAESMPDTKTTDTGAVTDSIHTEKEKASDELEVEINTDASPVLAESADVENEVTQVLPEKKKKRPLGDHLAEEKANDSSVTANKQVSDEKSEVEPSEAEQTATAVAPKESTEISSRDAISLMMLNQKQVKRRKRMRRSHVSTQEQSMLDDFVECYIYFNLWMLFVNMCGM
ncbi:hypothetical protein FCM35_KLT18786 [Carex littledalei]|uniref:Uncharacterized protein n=1 Tax=Carex littledalei TaxID=544730 RepID=A0A833QVW2_9POAL|nr:hypothetical protein FCM35_KLT18786 [Carex littledalei]